MDQITRAWYGKDIELQLHKCKEQAYEDLFCDLMEKKYSDNFQLVKAAGRDGDGKSDGYLIPEKCIYQVYAPSSGFQKSKLLNKIQGDFEGAKSKWGSKMTKWIFVHITRAVVLTHCNLLVFPDLPSVRIASSQILWRSMVIKIVPHPVPGAWIW
ncbi:hypothetical protein [Neptunomonas sp.]|uniref:hypothetical protein n=1 Tax=Neptunomonas sp. TaxID=1971898 RepID=UPI00356593DE